MEREQALNEYNLFGFCFSKWLIWQWEMQTSYNFAICFFLLISVDQRPPLSTSAEDNIGCVLLKTNDSCAYTTTWMLHISK